MVCLEEAYGGQFLSIEARISKEDWDGRSEATHSAGMSALAESVDAFSLNVAAREKPWIDRFASWSQDNTRTVIWGGGAKTVSFLNMVSMSGVISHVVDINPNKQGLYIPGSGQEIIAPDFLMSYQPDVVVLMNPIYRREVELKLKEIKVKTMLIDA